MSKQGNKRTQNYSNSKSGRKKVIHEQPRKDNKGKRVNFDNTRVGKFMADVEKLSTPVGPSPNDISWYSKNPTLLNAAGSIPFASVLGKTNVFDIDDQDSIPSLPGIMSFAWTPSLGSTNGVNVANPPYAINQAGRSMYSYIVHANSRNYTYEYQDLTILTLAGSNVFSIVAAMIRAYGIAKTYQEQNYFLPDGLLEAAGFNPSDIRNNLGNIWFQLNELIARVGQIWIPNVMPVVQRWMWLNTNIFKDASSVLGQIYMFTQDSFWQYSETAMDTGGCLLPALVYDLSDPANPKPTETFKPARSIYTWDQWMYVANNMIDALLESEDRGVIFGDILNTYGADKILAIAPIPVDYRIEPVYNQEVLTQIENLTTSAIGGLGVYQTPAGLFEFGSYGAYSGTLKATDFARYRTPWSKSVLNFHFPTQPTPADVMIATRLKTHGVKKGQGNLIMVSTSSSNTASIKITKATSILLPDTCGTEVVTRAFIWTKATPTYAGADLFGLVRNPVNHVQVQDNVNGTVVANGMSFDELGLMQTFDWCPFVILTCFSTPSDSPSIIGDYKAYGDYDNYTIIDSSLLSKLNTTALYSEFGVPQLNV